MKKFLLTILAIFIVAIGVAIVWLLTLDGDYDVKRSVVVNKPVVDVFELVQDFNSWALWSPWLCMEPNATVKVSGTGREEGDLYSWKGELVGSGTVKHVSIVPSESIHQEIVFFAPMESQSTVYWEFDVVDDSTTNLIWGMKGVMPFYLRFMTKMMEPYIGMDYERGLKMIKDYSEKGYVASNIEVIGIVDAPEIKFVGERVSCSLSEIGVSTKEVFPRLSEMTISNNLTFNNSMSVYHEFDFQAKKCVYTAAIPIVNDVDWGDRYYVNELPATKALKIKFTGDYEHLGNAWATGMNYMRNNKLREDKDIASYEIYLTNSMEESDERKWITEVYMPIK